MDTGTKIVASIELEAALRVGAWTVVPGLFDPLTAIQAKRLQALVQPGRKLAAIVLEEDDALLAADARAALVAALRAVDLVFVSKPDNWQALIPNTARIVEDATGEAQRSAEFVQFVLDRHTGVNGK